jgi:hypothetical protein
MGQERGVSGGSRLIAISASLSENWRVAPTALFQRSYARTMRCTRLWRTTSTSSKVDEADSFHAAQHVEHVHHSALLARGLDRSA